MAKMSPTLLWHAAAAINICLFFLSGLSHANPQHIELGIVAHPKSVLAEEGQSLTLSVLLKGPVKLLQWRKNGLPIEAANRTHIDVLASQTKSVPDTYDVLVQDAFGNTLVSNPATIEIAKPESPLLLRQNKNIGSLKLQSLFNLIHVFDQIAARVSEPVDLRKIRYSAAVNYPECPERSKVQLIEPTVAERTQSTILLLELDACFVPRASRLGEESGALISGKYRLSKTSIELTNKEVRVIEQMAENLTLRFPFAQDWGRADTIDFDVSLNGGLTLQTEINRSAANLATFRKESIWKRGTTIENPQTGVKAEFISGKHVQETFGTYWKDEFIPSRETEFFDKLTLKVSGDTVVLNGGITKIYDKADIHRHGQFSISVNGKHVLNTHSVVTAPKMIPDALPYSPKLNGFFLNDHPKAKRGEPIKMVSPGRESKVKVN